MTISLHESGSAQQRLLWTHMKQRHLAAPHTRTSDDSVSLPRHQWRQHIKRQQKRERPFFFEDKYCRVPERRGPHLPCRSQQRQTEITTSVVSPALILPHLSVRYAIKHLCSPHRAPCLSRKHSNVYAWEGGLVSKHGACWHSRHETPPYPPLSWQDRLCAGHMGVR